MHLSRESKQWVYGVKVDIGGDKAGKIHSVVTIEAGMCSLTPATEPLRDNVEAI